MVLESHEVAPTCLAFSPDGTALASGGLDFSVFLWDVSRLAGKRAMPARDLSAADLDACWADLGGDDAAKAHAAIVALGSAPKQAPAFLKERLDNAIERLGVKRIQQLIADLEDERFATRQKAARELEQLGNLPLAALEQVLKEKPSLEMRRRVEQLLQRLDNDNLATEQRRLGRAFEALEYVGSAEARDLLERVGAAPLPPALQAEAAASLKRMPTVAK